MAAIALFLLASSATAANVQVPEVPVDDVLPSMDPAGVSYVQRIQLASGDTLELTTDWPLAVLNDGKTRAALMLPPHIASKLHPGLHDLVALHEDGHMSSDGTIPVLVRTQVDDPQDIGLLPIDVDRVLPMFDLAAGRVSLEALPSLAEDSRVERVYLDGVATVNLAQSVSRVRADEAHAQVDATGANLVGTGRTIAIIDTGIDTTRPSLGGCFGAECKVIGGYDFVNDDADPDDDHGHGTHVADTAAGSHGVAPGASLLSYKVCNEWGSCQHSHILAAIEAAVNAGADVISMSLGGPGDADGPLATAADEAVRADVVVVSAAGNSGAPASIGEPGSSRLGITVGASDLSDQVAYFSSEGPVFDERGRFAGVKPDLVAPGVQITAAVPTGSCRLCDPSGTMALSGTSMATPHVSGAVAVLLQAYPDLSPAEVRAALSGRSVVLDEDPLVAGLGRLDVMAALSSPVFVDVANRYLGFDPSNLETFVASATVTAQNHGNTTWDVDWTVDAPAGSVNIEPNARSVSAGASVEFSFNVSINNGALDDGWTFPSATMDSSGSSRLLLSTYKGALLNLDLDPSVGYVMVAQDAAPVFSQFHPSPAQEIQLAGGTYQAMVSFARCPVTADDCNGQSASMVFFDDFEVNGTATLAAAPEDASNRFYLGAETLDGRVLEPADIVNCRSVELSEFCFGEWRLAVLHSNISWTLVTSSSGTNSPLYLSDFQSSWAVSRHTSFRDGGVWHTVANGTVGLGSDFEPFSTTADYLVRGFRYDVPADAETTRTRWCTWWGRGLGFSNGINEPLGTNRTETYVIHRNGGLELESDDWRPNVGLCEIAHVQVIVDGASIAGSSGLVADRHNASVVEDIWGREADDRYQWNQGRLSVSDGATVFEGEVKRFGDTLMVTKDGIADGWYRPAGGGTFAGDDDGRYTAHLDRQPLDSGRMDGFLFLPVPRDTPARLVIENENELVGQGNCLARSTYDFGPREGSSLGTPRLDWVRVTQGGVFTSRPSDLDDVWVYAALRDGGLYEPHEWPTVTGSVWTGERLQVVEPRFVEDDLLRFRVPDLGAGDYSLHLRFEGVSDSSLHVVQDPAFHVAAADECAPERPPHLVDVVPWNGTFAVGEPIRVDVTMADPAVVDPKPLNGSLEVTIRYSSGNATVDEALALAGCLEWTQTTSVSLPDTTAIEVEPPAFEGCDTITWMGLPHVNPSGTYGVTARLVTEESVGRGLATFRIEGLPGAG